MRNLILAAIVILALLCLTYFYHVRKEKSLHQKEDTASHTAKVEQHNLVAFRGTDVDASSLSADFVVASPAERTGDEIRLEQQMTSLSASYTQSLKISPVKKVGKLNF